MAPGGALVQLEQSQVHLTGTARILVEGEDQPHEGRGRQTATVRSSHREKAANANDSSRGRAGREGGTGWRGCRANGFWVRKLPGFCPQESLISTTY